MAYIVFGPLVPGTEGSRRAQGMVNAPFGFSAVGSAGDVVAQLDAGGGGFAKVQQVVAGGEPRQVYVRTSSVLWVEDD